MNKDTNEGMKFDEDKLRYDLIPPEVLLWLAELYTHGAKKYAPDNWKKVSIEKYIAAFHRHFNDWRLGIDLIPAIQNDGNQVYEVMDCLEIADMKRRKFLENLMESDSLFSDIRVECVRK